MRAASAPARSWDRPCSRPIAGSRAVSTCMTTARPRGARRRGAARPTKSSTARSRGSTRRTARPSSHGCICTTRTRRRPCLTRSAGSTPAISTPAVLRSPTRSSARLLDALRAKGVLDSTAIIVAGDHGESLGEHGEIEHGIFLYEGTLHVPMIMRAPGLPARRVTGLASLVDVLPTVVDLFGLEPMAVDGMDLMPTVRGRGELPGAIDLRRVDVCAAIRLESAARAARRPVQARRRAAGRALRPRNGPVRRARPVGRPARARQRDARGAAGLRCRDRTGAFRRDARSGRAGRSRAPGGARLHERHDHAHAWSGTGSEGSHRGVQRRASQARQ